jgi:hypothetical protein
VKPSSQEPSERMVRRSQDRPCSMCSWAKFIAQPRVQYMIYSRTNIPQSNALSWRGVVLGGRADQFQPPMDLSSVPRRKIPHRCHWSIASCVIMPSWISCAIVRAFLRVWRTFAVAFVMFGSRLRSASWASQSRSSQRGLSTPSLSHF